MKTRGQAREYFKQCGLTYSDIDIRALKYLQIEIDEEFNRFKREVINSNARGYWVRVNYAKYFKGKFADDGHMICAFITARGTHFNAREVVSFNPDGFIGFCGDTDDTNAQPVLNAFILWCDWLNERGK